MLPAKDLWEIKNASSGIREALDIIQKRLENAPITVLQGTPTIQIEIAVIRLPITTPELYLRKIGKTLTTAGYIVQFLNKEGWPPDDPEKSLEGVVKIRVTTYMDKKLQRKHTTKSK